jgi:hypothetical protein
MKFFFNYVSLVLILCILFSGCISSGEQKRLDIGKQSLAVAKNATQQPDSPIIIRGKVMLFAWYPEENNRFLDYYNSDIPSNLTYNGSESEVTVFFIADEQYKKVGTWLDQNGAAIPGYVRTSKIIAVYWPELSVAGVTHVNGSYPGQNFVETTYKGQIISSGYIRPDRGAPSDALVGKNNITPQWFSQLPVKS